MAFLTGLTAGGLSCMAVQGGLLASSIAGELEREVRAEPRAGRARPRLVSPIASFLVAKLLAYTLLGALLGALGSSLSLTPALRALLQSAIGVFMVGNALRLFNVHPIFRYFSFEPPSFVTRFIRKSSKGRTEFSAPVFLGAMTVLIPCGITQSMMAAALGTADPFAGAMIMFAFTLGASPAFFILSYSAARLGALFEKYLMRLVAVVLLIVGVLSVDTGLNLWAAPVSLTSTFQDLVSMADPFVDSATELTVSAKDNGYVPRTLNARADQAVKLNVVTLDTASCTRALVIPELQIDEVLPVTGIVTFDLPPQSRGKVIRFMCSGGMYTGQIVFH